MLTDLPTHFSNTTKVCRITNLMKSLQTYQPTFHQCNWSSTGPSNIYFANTAKSLRTYKGYAISYWCNFRFISETFTKVCAIYHYLFEQLAVFKGFFFSLSARKLAILKDVSIAFFDFTTLLNAETFFLFFILFQVILLRSPSYRVSRIINVRVSELCLSTLCFFGIATHNFIINMHNVSRATLFLPVTFKKVPLLFLTRPTHS